MLPDAEQADADGRRGTGGEDGLVEIVDRHVRSLIDWYQRKKRWPRRFYRATTTKDLLAASTAIRLMETQEFFAGQPRVSDGLPAPGAGAAS